MLRARHFALLPLLLGAAFARAQETPPPTDPPALTKEVKEEVLSAVAEVVTKRAFVPGVDLSKWPEFIEKQREAIDKAEKDSEFARAVNAALRDFGVSHIRFLAPRSAQARVRTSTIGVGLNARAEKEGLVITMVFPKSPADEAGLKLGDIIVEVDGKLPENSQVLQGDEGTELTLKVKDKDGNLREIKLTRKMYSTLREDTLKWVDDDSAVLRVNSFSRGYSRENIDKLMSEAAKAKFLVLDLRSNGGGATNNLQHLLSLLLPKDTVVGTFISRKTSEDYAKDHEGKVETDPLILAKEAKLKYRTREQKIEPFKGKIAVLVNGGSASASEICAEALKEHAGATVVGTRSMGAVLASVFRRLPQGYEMQYPISDYVSNAGIRLEKNPIVPDLVVTERPEEGKDPAVDKALEKLRAVR